MYSMLASVQFKGNIRDVKHKDINNILVPTISPCAFSTYDYTDLHTISRTIRINK